MSDITRFVESMLCSIQATKVTLKIEMPSVSTKPQGPPSLIMLHLDSLTYSGQATIFTISICILRLSPTQVRPPFTHHTAPVNCISLTTQVRTPSSLLTVTPSLIMLHLDSLTYAGQATICIIDNCILTTLTGSLCQVVLHLANLAQLGRVDVLAHVEL